MYVCVCVLCAMCIERKSVVDLLALGEIVLCVRNKDARVMFYCECFVCAPQVAQFELRADRFKWQQQQRTLSLCAPMKMSMAKSNRAHTHTNTTIYTHRVRILRCER